MYYKNKLLVMVAILVLPLFVRAQSPEIAPNAGSIPLGPFDLTPSLEFEYIDDDNITADGLNPTPSKITIVSPGFTLRFDDGLSGVSLDYLLQDASYSNNDNGNNDYTDQYIDFNVGTILAGMHRVEARAILIESHDPRASSPSGNLLDEFDDDAYRLSYTLGLEESPFSFRVEAEEFERRYTTNRTSTLPFDRDEESIDFDILYDFSTDLELSIEYSETDFTYVNDVNRNDPALTRDSSEEFLGFGVDWQITDAFELQLLIGETERDLVLGSRQGFSGTFWDSSLEWSPLSYSTLTLALSRYTDENTTLTVSEFTVRRDSRLAWVHNWTDNLSSEIIYLNRIVDYSSSDRTDDNDDYEIRVGYQFRRWLGFEVFYQDADRSSSARDNLGQDIFSYSQGVYGLSVLFNL